MRLFYLWLPFVNINLWFIFFLFILLAFLACALMGGCRSARVVTVPEVHTDTTYITQHQRDSVWLHDSIHVTDRGDTIRIERWHTKYIEREVHDTLYQSKRYSIPVPYEVIKEVPRKSTWFERTMFSVGIIALMALALFLAMEIKRHLP